MKLFHKELGTGQPLVILHGLFGFSDNWQTHANKLSEYFRVILVDLRNHGRSEWSDDFSYEIMANDVMELCQALNLEDIILVGHSMGGKVAMHFAKDHEDLLDKLVIVDMGIKAYPMHHQHILAGIHNVQLTNIKSRREAEKQLSQHIDSEGIKQFLLKNLYWKEKGVLSWRMNVNVLEAEMENILSALPEMECHVPTLFIRGGESAYVLDEDIEEIEQHFIDTKIVTIEHAGHWVHAESPDKFQEALLSFCLR